MNKYILMLAILGTSSVIAEDTLSVSIEAVPPSSFSFNQDDGGTFKCIAKRMPYKIKLKKEECTYEWLLDEKNNEDYIFFHIASATSAQTNVTLRTGLTITSAKSCDIGCYATVKKDGLKNFGKGSMTMKPKSNEKKEKRV